VLRHRRSLVLVAFLLAACELASAPSRSLSDAETFWCFDHPRKLLAAAAAAGLPHAATFWRQAQVAGFDANRVLSEWQRADGVTEAHVNQACVAAFAAR
jgi:hypothetical protein